MTKDVAFRIVAAQRIEAVVEKPVATEVYQKSMQVLQNRRVHHVWRRPWGPVWARVNQ